MAEYPNYAISVVPTTFKAYAVDSGGSILTIAICKVVPN